MGQLVFRVLGTIDIPAVLVRNLQLSDALLFFNVLRLTGVVLSLILAHSKQKRGVGLFLGHELLNDLSDIRVIGL